MDMRVCLGLLSERIPAMRSVDIMAQSFEHQQAVMLAYLHATHVMDYQVPVIAIAGTNGKGGCAKLIADVYQRSGYRVGLFTSPHVLDVNERIVVNGRMIEDEDFIRLTSRLLADKSCDSLTFFCVLTIVAWQFFVAQSVDVMVFEVGLGGRLDAVNALPLTAGVITSIGYDHMHVLGDNLDAIACEKSGIARASCPVIVAEPHFPEAALALLRSKRAVVYQWDEDFCVVPDGNGAVFRCHDFRFNIPSSRLHPQSIAAGLMLVQTLQNVLPVDSLHCQQAVRDWQMLGRMSCIDSDRHIWADVAHNAPAVTYLLSQWHYPWSETLCIVQFKQSKDWRACARAIAQVTSVVYVMTEVASSDDMKPSFFDPSGQSVTADQIQAEFPDLSVKSFLLPKHMMCSSDQEKLASHACKKLIFGSFNAVALAKYYLSDSSRKTLSSY